jgi:hypothetical protein
MKNNIEILTLVYKSVDYTRLMYKELKSDFCRVDGWDIGVRLILNDANDDVINEAKQMDIKQTIYNDEIVASKKNEFFMNRVYRAYNFGVKTSEYDNICFVNSDNIFSKNWLKNLLKHHNGFQVPCSRLVESGKMRSGQHAISKDFGRTPTDINYNDFYKYVDEISVDEIHDGGLYVPCVFNKQQFIDFGMFPEGDITPQFGIGTDRYFFTHILPKYNMKHITVFDSIVYHVQLGETNTK